MDLYAENILEHYRSPRNTGEGKNADVSHQERNVSCGDILSVHVFLENEILKKIEWKGTGCAISQAGMSMLSEELENMCIEDVLKLKKDEVYELFGVPIGPRRFKCALIGLHTVKNALRKHQGKDPQSWLDTVEIDEV